jgi:hypothetical protein
MNKRSTSTKAVLLASFLAGGMIVSATFAQADVRKGKLPHAPVKGATAATAPAAGNPTTRISPYTIENRRRAEASAAANVSAKPSSARHFHTVADRGNQH